MTDLTRRIEKLERALEPQEGPLRVIGTEHDRDGELAAAFDADVRVEREAAEPMESFKARACAALGVAEGWFDSPPRMVIRMVPDSGPLATS